MMKSLRGARFQCTSNHAPFAFTEITQYHISCEISQFEWLSKAANTGDAKNKNCTGDSFLDV